MLLRSDLNAGLIIFNDSKAIIGKITYIYPEYIQLENPFNNESTQLHFKDYQTFNIYDQNFDGENFIDLDMPNAILDGLNGWKIFHYFEEIENKVLREKIYQYEILTMKKRIEGTESTIQTLVDIANKQINAIGGMYNQMTGQYINPSNPIFHSHYYDSNNFMKPDSQIIDFFPKLKDKLNVLIKDGQ